MRALIRLAARDASGAQRGIRPHEKLVSDGPPSELTIPKTRLVGATLKLIDNSSVSSEHEKISAISDADVLRTNLPHMV
jgi:hypothetical protein